jgi:uncharacterized phage-associated protein
MALGTKANTPTSAMNVASMILLAAQERGIGDVTARKLQKLLYFTQLYHLGLQQSLAFHENLKAWEDGPVVPDVWVAFKTGRPAEVPITVNEINDLRSVEEVIALKPLLYEIVTKVVMDFGHFDQQELVDLTHGQLPWLEVWNDSQNRLNRSKGVRDSSPLKLNTMKAFAPVLLRHTRPNELGKNLETQILTLHQASGHLNFVRAKMNLADAAGQLDQVLAFGFDNDQIRANRAKLAEAVRAFTQSFGEKFPLGVDPNSANELDEFARALTDFGMAHRTR